MQRDQNGISLADALRPIGSFLSVVTPELLSPKRRRGTQEQVQKLWRRLPLVEDIQPTKQVRVGEAKRLKPDHSINHQDVWLFMKIHETGGDTLLDHVQTYKRSVMEVRNPRAGIRHVRLVTQPKSVIAP